MDRKEQDSHPREPLTDRASRLEPLGSLGRGHTDVQDDQIRCAFTDQLEELGAVAGLSCHVETGAAASRPASAPAWTAMIAQRRRTNAAQARKTHWGRRGGTFHKGDEFFKK